MPHLTNLNFVIADVQDRLDGRRTVHSTAYHAMRQFEDCADLLDGAIQQKREADAAFAAAEAKYRDALAELVEKLYLLYGEENMPEAFEMPGGVLVFEWGKGPRFIRTRSWSDTYRIVDGEEAAPCPT